MAEEFRTPQSANEAALQNWAGADNELRAPQSRIEKLLLAILGENVTPDPPQSVNEELLTQILEQGVGGNSAIYTSEVLKVGDTISGETFTQIISNYGNADRLVLVRGTAKSGSVTKNIYMPITNVSDVQDEDSFYAVESYVSRTIITGTEEDIEEIEQLVINFADNNVISSIDVLSDRSGTYTVQEIWFEVYEASDKAGIRVEPLTVTENGTYKAEKGKAYSPVTVNTPVSILPKVIDRSVTEITESDLEGVATIGSYAFANCRALAKIIIPNSVTEISSSAFFQCVSLTFVEIPDSVAILRNGAFSSCGALKSIVLSNSLEEIYTQTFQYCRALESVDIPNSVKYIGSSAFNSCVNMKSVTIGENVTEMGQGVFGNCQKLMSITLLSIIPPKLGGDIFYNVPADCAIYVPAESVEAYKAAQYWSARADYIQAIPE